jgi:hypothetical protein
MRVGPKKLPPALKHGAYSAMTLLPGEDPVAFEKLHRGLVAEHRPHGLIQEDTVRDIARCMWRKQNLETLRIAEAAHRRYSAIKSEMIPSTTPPRMPPPTMGFIPSWTPPGRGQVEAAKKAAEDRAREELGENYEFIEMGGAASVAQLLADLEVEERLDARIDKLFKRLWLLQASESLSSPDSSTTLPRISGPKKAA